MKHFILALSCVALAAFTACSTEEKVAGSTPGTGINFVLSSPASTRTTWGADEAGQQLYWDIAKDEKVAVASMQTTSHTPAVYQVENSYDNVFSLVPNQADGLKWGTGEHTFYALYPANGTNSVINGTSLANGTATFLMNETQTCTVDDAIPDANGNYNLSSDPSQNAFMVADTTVASPSEKVSLQFKPIMTTIRFVVKGPSGANNLNKAIHLKGINVTYPAYQSFNYDIKTGKISGGGSPNSNYQVKVRIKNGNKDYLNLGYNETATFNVYLPPMSQDDPAQKNLKVDVVSWGDNGDDATIAEKKVSNFTALFEKGKKTVFKLPALTPPNANPNAWMSQLDDRVYVSQLSIPGAHDCATGAGMTSTTGEKYGRTQNLSISQLWDQGVRCFDMRVANWDNLNDTDWDDFYHEQDRTNALTYFGENPLWMYHGYVRTKIGWSNITTASGSNMGVTDQIKAKLTANPGDFVIFILRHENDRFPTTGTGYNHKDLNPKGFNDHMKEWLDKNKDWFVEWRPDLTVGECRGKIVLLSRDPNPDDVNYNQPATNAISKWTWNTGAFVTGWKDDGTPWDIDKDGINNVTIHNSNNTLSCKLYLQDYYRYDWSVGSFPDNKVRNVQTLLNESVHFSDQFTKYGNSWAINYLSAYYIGLAYAGAGLETIPLPTTYKYQRNAKEVQTRILPILQGMEGPIGIMMQDFVGYDEITTEHDHLTIDGEKIVNTIINNNYKFKMVRKGEQ